MKAILSIPEKELTFEYDNLSMDMFTPVEEEQNLRNLFVTFKPGGPPITLITNNMPQALKDEVTTIIKKFCNH